MKTIEIYGENHFEIYTKMREACRGVLISDGKILLTYEVNTNQWFIPGGGAEDDESHEECCIREMAEETGYIVNAAQKYLTINEYYEEWLFISHYFICECVGETKRKLTEREIEVGLEPRWIPLDEALEIFSKHQDYADENEMKRGAYLREYKALSNLVEAEICRKVLEKCISIYEEFRNIEDSQESLYGIFPKCVQMTQFRTIRGKTRLSNKKENIQFWKYENTQLTSVEAIKDSTLFAKSGMFYEVACFYFEIEAEKVILEYVFGPRFGRGSEFKIRHENGQISLVDEKHIWVS